MNIVVFNDTSNVGYNPGCAATIHSIEDLIKEKYPLCTISKIPLGFKYGAFSQLGPVKPGAGRHKKWRQFVTELKGDVQFLGVIESAQTVVFNLEGTVHHNSTSALALLGLAAAAGELGKTVILTNGTFQSIDNDILIECADVADKIVAREALSANYLEEVGVPFKQGIDCVFNKVIWEDRPYQPSPIKGEFAIYTGGVKFAYPLIYGIDLRAVIPRHMTQIIDMGFQPYYLQMENSETIAAKIAESSGAKIINMKNYNWFDIKTIVENASLVVSGRYHIVIFALLWGRPFIALESNSWKTDGLFDLLGLSCKTSVARSDLASDLVQSHGRIHDGNCAENIDLLLNNII